MSEFTRWMLTLVGIFLVATELVGDLPGAALGFGLIGVAWLKK